MELRQNNTNIYAFDSNNVNNYQSYLLPGVINTDWEEISQDDTYLYLGDFGNNANGNRTDLKILRIDKNSVHSNSPIIDTINFSYSNQTDFSPTGANNTDFDCESFIVSNDSIYLFTKQWVSNKTSIYSFPKTKGTHIANYRATLDVKGLITGAVYSESKRLIVLCGYSSLLQPFIYLLYDFSDKAFLSGNKRKINLSLPFHQVEGITTNTGLIYYITNEKFVKSVMTIPAKLQTLDLSAYLSSYLNRINTNVPINYNKNILIYPNPFSNQTALSTDKIFHNATLTMINTFGQTVKHIENINGQRIIIERDNLPAGVYFCTIKSDNVFETVKLLIID